MPKPILIVMYFLAFNLAFCLGQGSNRNPAVADAQIPLSRGADASGRNSYRYYLEQRLKSDLSSLFQLGREITKQTHPAYSTANYKYVSQRANKIRKLARRIKLALTLGKSFEENNSVKAYCLEVPSPEILHREILEINTLVHKIGGNYSKVGRYVVNAKLQTELYQTVETLESLALHVKESAEELSQLN